MRLRELLLIVWALVLCPPAFAQASAPALSASAVRAAVEAVRADPLLPQTDKTKALRFKDDEKEKKKTDEPNLKWWADLIGNISGGLRVAMWLVVAGLLILLLLRLRDLLMWRERGVAPNVLTPTHVGSLDIRPESLPADIGAAARALLGRGELRAALSLLYRGALSRLVHVHGVPIRSASTENECVALASRRLAPSSQAYLSSLVQCWQSVAYAKRQPLDEDLERLCAEFDAQLSAPVGTRAAA